MAVEALVTPLLSVPLFQGLSPLQLARLARSAERIVFQAGEIVIANGESGDAAFLIVSGPAVRSEAPDGSGRGQILDSNSLVGEMAMLVDTEHTSTVITRGQVRALKFTRASLYELMQRDSTLADHFVDKIAARLSDLASQLKAIDEGLITASEAMELMEHEAAPHAHNNEAASQELSFH